MVAPSVDDKLMALKMDVANSVFRFVSDICRDKSRGLEIGTDEFSDVVLAVHEAAITGAVASAILGAGGTDEFVRETASAMIGVFHKGIIRIPV